MKKTQTIAYLIDFISSGGKDIESLKLACDTNTNLKIYLCLDDSDLESYARKFKRHKTPTDLLEQMIKKQVHQRTKRKKRSLGVIASIKSGFKDKSILELDQIANDCLPYVQTNLSSVEFANLMFNMTGYVNGDFKEMTLPKKGTYKGLGNVDFEANSRILREFLYE